MGVNVTNTDVMFSSKTDLWETPQELFDQSRVLLDRDKPRTEIYITGAQNEL